MYILFEKSNENSDEYIINMSTNQLLYALNMINKNYKTCRNKIDIINTITNVSKDMVYDFYNDSNVELKRKLESSLNKMSNEKLIIWSKSKNVHLKKDKYTT